MKKLPWKKTHELHFFNLCCFFFFLFFTWNDRQWIFIYQFFSPKNGIFAKAKFMLNLAYCVKFLNPFGALKNPTIIFEAKKYFPLKLISIHSFTSYPTFIVASIHPFPTQSLNCLLHYHHIWGCRCKWVDYKNDFIFSHLL